MSTVWNNITTEPASYASVDSGNGSNIVRLVEDPDVKKNIQFDELSIKYTGVETGSGGVEVQTQMAGAIFPVVRINDMEFGVKNIVDMTISSDSFLPSISLSLRMNSNEFVVTNMPKDGDIVSTFIRTNTYALNYLRNDFIITSCSVDDNTRGVTNVDLSGHLFVPGIESDYNLFGLIGTSRTVCKEVAKKFNIGFAYNDEEDTDDYQSWVCSGSATEFVEDVVSHSWKNNTSFYNTWIDLYYNLCFVNVNKFLLSNGKEEVDVTFASNIAVYQGLAKDAGEDADTANVTIKMLSNNPSFRGTPFYVTGWDITNNAARISMSHGYVEEAYVFMHNQHLYTEDSSACFAMLNNIPAYDQDKLDSYMILRGRTTYDPSTNTNEKARVNYDMQNLYIRRTFTGVDYVISDDTDRNSKNNNEWTGNVHKNFSRAALHNSINLAELDKMYITVETDGLCLQIMRGEKVPIVLENPLGSNVTTLDESNFTSTAAINRMYSGYYIVDSIEYGYDPKRANSKTTRSPFYTSFTLKRREWPAPEEIKKGN